MKLHADRWVALAVGLALGTGFLVSQRPHERTRAAAAADGAPVPVTVTRSRALEIPVVVEAMGTVRSRRQTQIAARVLAEIKEIRRAPGERAEPNDVLVVLDDRDLVARVDQAKAQLRAAEHGEEESRVEFERAKNLVGSGAVTRQQFDTARFRLATAEAEKAAAGKNVEAAQVQLSFATIAAPFAGWVYEKLADPGDLAAPGKPILGLYDPAQLRLEAVVEEFHLWQLKNGDSLQVALDAPPRVLDGRVSEIVPAVDPASRTGLVKIDLPAEPGLRPGAFGRARIVAGRRTAVVVPESALVRRGQLELVFVAVPDAGRTRAALRLVRAGAAGEHGREILSGLAADEPVVASGADRLRDGDLLAPSGEAGK